MRIVGTTVSVGYHDFLSESLPLNKGHFDDFIVVTAPEDRETQRIAQFHGVRHAQTDHFRSRWGEFHKAKGINVGLSQLAVTGTWVVHMDADIVLPPRFRDLVENADLDKTKLYGVDRYLVPGYDAWCVHKAMPALQQDNYHVNMDIFDIAPRFSGGRMRGYAPPGFFQMWYPDYTNNIVRYPDEHTSAAKTDVLFASKWWRNKRELLPEFLVYHLESEPAAQGANWGGRITKRFGPEVDEQWHHHPRHHRHPPHHHHHHHHHPYYCEDEN